VALLPVAGAGVRLLLGRRGHDLRQRLLLTLVRDGRLHLDDLQALGRLLRRQLDPSRLAGQLLQGLTA
jgi:hypothetical protein